MMRYLLDAKAVIGLLNNPSSRLGEKVRSQDPEQVAISAIVVHELYYGAFRSKRAQRNVGLVDRLRFVVVPFDGDDARCAGEVRAGLAAAGTPIGPYDVLIAGQAKARNLILITHNVLEFRRVPGLRMEDWES